MFKPLHSLVTVVLDKKDAKTSGGLVLPDNFGDVFLTGTVRAVGKGRNFQSEFSTVRADTPALQPGDRVMLAQHVQTGPRGSRTMSYPEIVDEGVKCVLCDYSDIVGVIESKPIAQA